jgi:N-acetylglucosamine kinase-like BadF-type ATPase
MTNSNLLAALDIGGTKSHLVIEDLAGNRIIDVVEPSLDWEAEPEDEAALWIAARVERHVPTGGTIVSLAFGAQGINRSETSRALEAALAAKGYPTVAVNDAALIVAAGGFTQGFGIIAGTGAIGVGANAEGKFLAAGGWGCVIGDEGSAASLVREATRAALRAHDEGKADDGLLGHLISTFGVSDPERLTRQVNDDPTSDNWAPHAPAIFAAANTGSALAQAVIVDGARYLADLIGQLRNRGAVGADVVVAGSVIVNQARLYDAFRRFVVEQHPDLRVHVLHAAPVEGAVLLARQAASVR